MHAGVNCTLAICMQARKKVYIIINIIYAYINKAVSENNTIFILFFFYHFKFKKYKRAMHASNLVPTSC
jgi:hypothetical protein